MAQNPSCPWIVECLEDFLYYCCPECNNRHQTRDKFLQHALNEHSEAKTYLIPIIGNKKITLPKDFQLLYRPASAPPSSPIDVKNEDKEFDENLTITFSNSNQNQLNKTEDDVEEQMKNDIRKRNEDWFNDISKPKKQHGIIEWNQSEKVASDDCKDLSGFEKNYVNCDTVNINSENVIRDKSPHEHSTMLEKKPESHKGLTHYDFLTFHKGEKYKCDLCGKLFSHLTNLKKHLKMIHEGPENPLQCKRCNKIFSRNNVLKKHILEVHEGKRTKDHKCDICGHIFSESSGLKLHIKSVHEQIKDHKCNDCNKAFSTRGTLKTHIENVHEDKRNYKCEKCDIAYKERKTLNAHIRHVHEGQEKVFFMCESCGKSLATDYSLKIHIRSEHEGKKDYECDLCGKLYSSKSPLLTHISRVHEGKRFVCDNCGNLLKSKASLNNHIMAVHGNQKDHKCQYCSTPFYITGLSHHEKICPKNTQRLFFSCQKCKKSFSQNKTLKLHINNVHEGRRDHKCGTCGKSFQGLSYMKLHINTVHLGVKKYQCSFCKTAYGQNGDLSRHIKRCHSKENIQVLEDTGENMSLHNRN